MTEYTWTFYSPGLPGMTVPELEIMYGSNTLRAATWGRGLWEFGLDGSKDFPSIVNTTITDPPTEIKPQFGADQTVTSIISYDSSLTTVYVVWSADAPTFENIIKRVERLGSQSMFGLIDFASMKKIPVLLNSLRCNFANHTDFKPSNSLGIILADSKFVTVL